MRKHALLPAVLFLASFFFASCASRPPVISDDATAMELIQRAQEASDRSDWGSAIVYYETVRERFGTDPAILAACKYEIAFIQYKQGKFALSEEGFLSLIALYESPVGASLPPRFLILARRVLPVVRQRIRRPEN
ncbi:MAG TPA: hypothetical protein VLH39_04835 [Magnetospirillaceae bacterium]|nr:hypothetical protein [Magnetospirillaceae bacterium]